MLVLGWGLGSRGDEREDRCASTSTKASKAEARGPRTQGHTGLGANPKSTAPPYAAAADVPGGPKARPARIPLRRIQTACRCTAQVSLPGTASRGGSVLLGVLCATGARGYRVPRSRRGLGISAGSSGIVRPPSTASSRTRLHPPSSFPPPSESCDRRPALRTPDDLATARRPESASRGVPVPSSRHQQATSTVARSSHAPS